MSPLRETIEKIEAFVAKHHVMTLSTSRDNAPQSCSLFYAYMPQEQLFVVASSEETEHMQNVLINPKVAGTVVLETKTVGKIEGLQFKGIMSEATDAKMRSAYYAAFPYARALSPTLWCVVPETMKLTDNRLGFGKKLNWTRGVSA